MYDVPCSHDSDASRSVTGKQQPKWLNQGGVLPLIGLDPLSHSYLPQLVVFGSLPDSAVLAALSFLLALLVATKLSLHQSPFMSQY